jgi:hypothetical protein
MPKSLALVCIEAEAVLVRVAAEGFALIKPRDEDYLRVFVPSVAARARAGYEALWGSPPPWPGRSDQTEFHVTAAYAEDFATDEKRAAAFPGGYRDAAPSFQPHTTWILWEVVTPGERNGITFDGLVPIDDRFAWFPKPWRVVREAE